MSARRRGIMARRRRLKQRRWPILVNGTFQIGNNFEWYESGSIDGTMIDWITHGVVTNSARMQPSPTVAESLRTP